MTDRFTLQDVQTLTYKRRDAWWTVLLVDPLASRLVVVTANRTSITPNQLTWAGLLLGACAAALFALARPWSMIVGAALFHLSFVLDCMDGKIARLKGTGSVIGGWLDYMFDRLRVMMCAAALFGGQYARSGNAGWLWLAFAVVFLDMLRYMDVLQIAKVRLAMQAAITTTCVEVGVDPARYLLPSSAEDATDEGVDDADVPEVSPPATSGDGAFPATGGALPPALRRSFGRRFRWWPRYRNALVRRRIRPHVFSGIEFQMFVFIVGAVAGAFSPPLLAGVTVFSCVALMAFEAFIIVRMLMSTRDLQVLLARIRDEHA